MTFSDDARRASDGVTHTPLETAGPLGPAVRYYIITHEFDDPDIDQIDTVSARVRAWQVRDAWIILGPDNDWYHLTPAGLPYPSTPPPFSWERVREWCRHFTEIVGERNT